MLHYRVKHKSFKKVAFALLITKLCQTLMITWIVNWFEKHILQISNIFSLLQWPLTQLAYCQSSKYLPLAHMQASRRSLSTALCWRPCQMSNSPQLLNS